MKKLTALHDAFYGGRLIEAGSSFTIPDTDPTPAWAAPADEVEVVHPARQREMEQVAMSQLARKGVGDNPLDAMDRLTAARDAMKPKITRKAPAEQPAPVKARKAPQIELD